jgi:phosphoribosylglycinamide formyltransferase-1
MSVADHTLGVLASGSGSNAMAIADACASGLIHTPLACIVCDRPDAPVIERARARDIEVVVIERRGVADAAAHDARIVAALRDRGAQWVVLAGYMRMCGPVFLHAYQGRAVNVHPSLLPAFPGRDAIGDALASGATTTGVTVHFIDAGMDTGPIICQSPVPIHPGDDRAALTARIQAVEHELLPAVVARLTRGELTIPSTPQPLQEVHPA